MKFGDLLAFIGENIRRQRGRVILTSLGVVIGSAAIILLVALVGGLQQTATAQFANSWDLTQVLVYSESRMGMPANNGSQNKPKMLTPDTIEEIAVLPNVLQVFAEQQVQGGQVSLQEYTGYVNLTGVGLDDLAALGMQTTQGSLALHRGVIIIGAKVKESFSRIHYTGQSSQMTTSLLNKTLRLDLVKSAQDGSALKKTFQLRVSGVLKESGGNSDYTSYISMADADDIAAWMTGKRVNHSIDGYSGLVVQVNDTNNVKKVAAAINDMGLQAMTLQSMLDSANSVFLILQLIFGGVGAITLVVAAIGIANTMTMAILERTKEIGLLKALGASNRDILSIFLGEATAIGLIGGIGGVILGVVLGKVIDVVIVSYLQSQAASNNATFPTTVVFIPFYLPLFALIFSMSIGTLSGLYPSLKAASLPPVMALKHE
jgi:putative ABC transport system permease protein